MRRTTTIGVAGGCLALSLVMFGAAQASAQTPYGKYPTRESCEKAARKLDRDYVGELPKWGHAWYPGEDGKPCESHPNAPKDERWWLYAY